MKNKDTIILCTCSHRNLFDIKKLDIIESGIANTCLPIIKTDDLCGEITKKNKVICNAVASKGTTTIIACHKRAVKWLLMSAGLDPEQDKIDFINLHDSTLDIQKKLKSVDEPHTPKPDTLHIKSPQTWVPWFPVIDMDRCTHCRQCMSFCLFKVYGLDDNKKVFVKNPENCKNNCPACARICPEIAIIFPKLTESPINGEIVSDNPTGEDGNKNLRIDMNAMRDGDMMSALKTRNAKDRTTLLKRKNIEKALEERKKCGCENIGPFNVINKN